MDDWLDEKWMDGGMIGLKMDGWMIGWMDDWLDEKWMDGWMVG